MSEEKEPKPTGESTDSKTDESAAAAKEAAGDFMKNATTAWGRMPSNTKIYLIAMVVMFLCSLIFPVVSGLGAFGVKATMASAGFWGFLIIAGGLGGIGLTIWSEMAERKDSWLPIAIAGCAGAAALSFLYAVIRFREAFGHLSPLGFWIPLVAAGVATTIAVMRIVKA